MLRQPFMVVKFLLCDSLQHAVCPVFLFYVVLCCLMLRLMFVLCYNDTVNVNLTADVRLVSKP